MALGLPRRLIPACLSFSTKKPVVLKIMEKTNTSTNFTWIKFFNAMLKKICSEYDKTSLYEVFNKVFPKNKNDLGVVDPLTFIAFCNYSNGDNNTNKQALCDKAKKELRLDEYDTPTDFNGIPYFDARFQRFFFRRENEAGTIDFLWKFAKYVINHNGEISDNLGNELDSVIFKIHNKNCISWAKISKFLFICFPNKYFPADENTKDYTGWEKLDNFEDFNNYQQALKNKYNEPPYIVSHKAWTAIPTEYPNIWAVGYAWSNGNQDDRFIRDNIWQYHHPNEKDLENFNNVKIGDIFALKSTYTAGPNHKITAAKIRAIGKVKEKIDDETFSVDWQIQDLPKEFRGCFCPWTTIGKFKPSKSDEIIKFIREYIEGSITMQKLQPQMKSKPTPLNIPLNQILYGPPGTGKTYNTVIKAMEIIDPALIEQYKAKTISYDDVKKEFDKTKDNHQIEFVTFHQSYSYEEFVEGIKPNLEKDSLSYYKPDGIFKKICKNASKKLYRLNNNQKIQQVSFKDVLDSFKEKHPEGSDFENLLNISYKNNNLIYHFGNQEEDRKIDLLKMEQLFNLNKQYRTSIDFYNDYGGSISLKGYHHTFYKELLNIKNILEDEKQVAIENNKEYVVDENAPKYVLIIDEINRGNISKIFGELITLIEPDKRKGSQYELKVSLPYSPNDELFGVPKNLYIIGTMNTSDRSIASIDIALRRRFKFIEMMPDKNLVADFGIGFKDIFEKLNTRIKLLLDRDHQIGHSYFINTKYENSDAVTLKEIWFSEIIPLLNEYFYCDWEKLRRIIPGFLKQVPVPDDLKGECEDSIYEFKTREEVSDLKAAFEQKDIKKDS